MEASENEAINKLVDSMDEYVTTVVGITREFGSFKAAVNDDLSIVIVSASGWAVVYPSMSETWAILLDWLKEWTEEYARNMEIFVKILAFPTSVRISDIDEQYIEDIVRAHDSLTDRNASKQE